MIKHYKVTVELFWSAERIETVVVKCHTKHTAYKLAEKYFKNKYPNVSRMIKILKVEEVYE